MKEREQLLRECAELTNTRDQLIREQAVAAQAVEEAESSGDSEALALAKAEAERLTALLNQKQIAEAARAVRLTESKQRRKQIEAKRKALLSRENVAKYVQKYFVETSACFIMDRDAYKDRFGLSPYNKIVVIPASAPGGTDDVQHFMASTGDKFYKFCELLVDVENFVNHKNLFSMFISLVNEGTSLVRISEKLHLLYLQFYRKDFIKDLRYKEDFENILILVSNHYLVRDKDFRKVFTNVPFDVKTADYTQVINYLDNADLRDLFETAFPNYTDLGFDTLYQAMYLCFIDSIKFELDAEDLVTIIIKDAPKMSKLLKRQSERRGR